MKLRTSIPEFVEIYNLIPREKKFEFFSMLGYNSCNAFTGKTKISKREFDFLVNYTKPYSYNLSSNTILEYVPFDKEQVIQHYTALTKLISNDSFQLYKPHEKDKLIDYQNELSRQLLRKNLF